MAGGFEHGFPWDFLSLKRKRSVSKARVMALYPIKSDGEREDVNSLEEEVVERDSLEAVTTEVDLGEISSRVKITASDRAEIYVVATQNLEERKALGYSCVRWKDVIEILYLRLPHLRGFRLMQFARLILMKRTIGRGAN